MTSELKEIKTAVKSAINEMLSSTRGANLFGAGARVVDGITAGNEATSLFLETSKGKLFVITIVDK